MMEQHSGNTINIASIAGTFGGPTSSPPYTAAKAGLVNLTTVAAASLAQYTARVNAIAPIQYLTLLIAVVVSALLIAGCGSSGDDRAQVQQEELSNPTTSAPAAVFATNIPTSSVYPVASQNIPPAPTPVIDSSIDLGPDFGNQSLGSIVDSPVQSVVSEIDANDDGTCQMVADSQSNPASVRILLVKFRDVEDVAAMEYLVSPKVLACVIESRPVFTLTADQIARFGSRLAKWMSLELKDNADLNSVAAALIATDLFEIVEEAADAAPPPEIP